MPQGTLPGDRGQFARWAEYSSASKNDVIQGRLARWYQGDIVFQSWVLAASPRAWNYSVRIYLRSAILRLQRWWRSCLGALHVGQVLSGAADHARIRATLFHNQLANLGEWNEP